MAQTLREIDVFGRWGGEEFMCILPYTGSDDAIRCAERLRQSLRGVNCSESRLGLQVTASFGIATAQDGDGVQDIVKRCDQALYRAKSDGRDRVVAYSWSSDAT